MESGTQAWKILEEVINDIYIVLSEAVMPSISGIDLLCMITKKTTCKDIPMISEYFPILLSFFVKVINYLLAFFTIDGFNCYTWGVLFAVMSSHDSTSMVVKCFSKGAVDFLVKPIRKNELKNLWQHVWRKCQIVSFSFLL